MGKAITQPVCLLMIACKKYNNALIDYLLCPRLSKARSFSYRVKDGIALVHVHT